eukprot:scaffold2824_cov142-Skeletonema_menzelii.AAC.4
MKRSTSIYTSLPSQQRLELKNIHTLVNDKWPVIERMPDAVDKPERRGAIIISKSSMSNTMSDSILKKLASIEITPTKRKSAPSYRTLLKKRAHSRRKNRVVIIDDKVVKNLSCEISSLVEVQPLELY